MRDSAQAAASPRSRPAGEPPWHGALSIGLFFASALVLTTYTLLPLPGQRAFGAGNYWLAGALFVVQLVLSRFFQRRAIRDATRG